MKGFRFIAGIVIFALILVAAAYFLPWQSVKWGKFEVLPAATITVSGEAQTQQSMQLATFTAGVSEVNDNKDTAVKTVNTKVEALITTLKEFGIPTEDIKTQNISVYRMEEPVTKDGRQTMTPGAWRASNDIAITLRDLTKASDLTDLLTASGATNIYGPNFAVDDTQNAQVGLLGQAIQNAREKAFSIAVGSNKKLGEIINVQEGGVSNPIYPMLNVAKGLGGGGAPIEPGTQTVSKSVTVTFELQ